MQTKLTKLLHIEHPVIQGGMAWIADASLASAVSNAGGLGIISAMNANADWVRSEIRACKAMTDKPFGVNLMLMSPFVEEVAKVVAEEKVPVVTTGAGNPSRFVKMWKEAGITILPVVASTALAKIVERAGVDAVIATPGRLLDHIRQRNISLNGVRWLILDEVDRMFDMGFIEDVSNIIRYCPKQRQTLFFSATMPDAVLRLSKWALKDPETVGVGVVHSPADTIEHFIYPVDGIQKYDMLIEVLKSISFESLIVFTRTRIDADRIGEWLIAHDYAVSILHSDRTQRERDKALKDFKDGGTRILVATDIASRGLDISNVGYVINYNVPEHSEDYVHRIGRTGRANREGKAITLYSSDETEFLKRIEAFIGAKIERRRLEGFAYRTEPVLEEQAPRKRKRNR